MQEAIETFQYASGGYYNHIREEMDETFQKIM